MSFSRKTRFFLDPGRATPTISRNMSETEEERKARKAAKKEKKASKKDKRGREDDDSGEGPVADVDDEPEAKKARKKEEKTDGKKRRAEDGDDEEKKPSSSSSSKAVSGSTGSGADGGEMPSRRARTRSMSFHEEENEGKVSAVMTPETFRSENQIVVVGRDADGKGPIATPAPMLTFASTPFAPPLRRSLDAAGFPNPTPTQAQCWPVALTGRDVITVAKTGSGKTCGFLLPAFHRLLEHSKDRKRGPPGILVLAPTRELACQIEEEAVKFGRTSNIRSTCAYGGAPKGLQIRKIQAGLEVLIATPGRLNDLLEMKVVDLSQVLFLVLDEADRM